MLILYCIFLLYQAANKFFVFEITSRHKLDALLLLVAFFRCDDTVEQGWANFLVGGPH